MNPLPESYHRLMEAREELRRANAEIERLQEKVKVLKADGREELKRLRAEKLEWKRLNGLCVNCHKSFGL